jgi:hypothetical protein
MRPHAIALVAILGLTAAACSLNPQPLPPDNPGDAAGSNTAGGPGSDAGVPQFRAEGGVDASSASDAPGPLPPPGGDGGASDADTDGSPSDAPLDAPPAD